MPSGALWFGVIIGWITYRTLRRATASPTVSDIGSVAGAIGGAALTKLFANTFDEYCIGLAIGFFGYFIIAIVISYIEKDGQPVSDWMMRPIPQDPE